MLGLDSSIGREEKAHAANDGLRFARSRDRLGVDGAETVADKDFPAVASNAGSVAKGLHKHSIAVRRENDAESATRWNARRRRTRSTCRG